MALAALRRQATGPNGRRRFAQSASLAARFASTFDEGASWALEAARLEPLDPLHRLRLALHCLRFGLHERALSVLDELGTANELPGARAVRALTALQAGEERRAANIAREIFTANPTLVLAMFLQAEALIARQPKESESRTQALPRDPRWATAWTHLLVKQMVARPHDAAKVAKQHLELRPALAKGSAQERLVLTVAIWCAASAEELASTLTIVEPGCRAEELLLSLLHERLLEDTSCGTADALRKLRVLHEAHPSRAAVRRVFVAVLTRSAAEHAARDEWRPALSAIEVAARLEPYEPTHLQNRAAVLTAMADDAQHQAWADLDRLHQRLALSGRLDPETALQIAGPHRMFAEQARLSPGSLGSGGRTSSGVFEAKEETLEGAVKRKLVVNQAGLDADPEPIRQLIHHRRAELVFKHLALGPDPRQALLEPEDPKSYRARVQGLAIGAESLATLVADEGRRLADRLADQLRRLRPGRTRYRRASGARLPSDARSAALKLQYVSAIADFVVLAWTWQVDATRPDIVEELLATLDATVPFLDSDALQTLLASESSGEPSNVRALNVLVRSMFEATRGELELDDAGRKRLARRAGAELLLTLATRQLEAVGALSGAELTRVLAIVDRARDRDPEYARVEYIAARLLTIGEFYDEARLRAERLARIAGKESPFQRGLEEVQHILDAKRRARVPGKTRSGAPQSDASSSERTSQADEGGRAQRLEDELKQFPTSVELHEELARELCRTGLFDAARSWTKHAIGSCLTRKAQLRARSLDLEVSALQLLARAHFDSVQLYLAGSRSAALPGVDAAVSEAEADADASYALHYLRGVCLLAGHDHRAAERAFQCALRACPAQLHRAVLRPLAESVEAALLDQSKVTVERALASGSPRKAMHEIAAAIVETRTPEAYLLELAQVHFAVAVAEPTQAADAQGAPHSALPPLPDLDAARAPWRERVGTALAESSSIARARAVASLASELHEPSRKEAAVLLRRIQTFATELAFAEAITEAARLERRGEVEAALTLLEGAGERALTDVRGLRLRVMLLLRIGRFEDADDAFELLQATGHPGAQGLVAKYPELRCKYVLGAANRLLRSNELDRAYALLVSSKGRTGAEAPEGDYALAFCMARLSRRSLEAGNREEAIVTASAALALLEAKLATPDVDAARHARLLELRDRLDSDLSYMQDQRT